MTLKRRYSLFFAVVTTVIALAGCGSVPEPSITEEPAPDLTMAPTLLLSPDQLDGSASLEIRSGAFNWNYKSDHDTVTGAIACGPHPLDDEELSHTAVLTLSQHDETVSVPYSFSCRVAPDELVIRKWNHSDLGNYEAQEISVTTLEDPTEMLELEAGYVYEFTAVWSEDKLNENGFYGTASYVLAT